MDGLTKRPESHLIGGPKTDITPAPALSLFILSKFLPFLVVLICSSFSITGSLTTILFLASVAFGFWIIKTQCGWAMVGMKWSRGIGGDPFFCVEFEPPPYMPNFFLSNSFWFGFVVALLLWAATFIIFVFHGRLLLLLSAVIGFAADALNFCAFLKGYSIAQKENAQIMRGGFLDESEKFPVIADEQDNSDGDRKRSDSDVV
jgi:hypothetical protein